MSKLGLRYSSTKTKLEEVKYEPEGKFDPEWNQSLSSVILSVSGEPETK